MKRSGLLTRLGPCRPLFLEERVVLMMDRDRAYRTDPDDIRLVLGWQFVHVIRIDVRRRTFSVLRRPVYAGSMSLSAGSDIVEPTVGNMAGRSTKGNAFRRVQEHQRRGSLD